MGKHIIIRNIDESLHKALKIKAVRESKTLQDVIKEILAKAMQGKCE